MSNLTHHNANPAHPAPRRSSVRLLCTLVGLAIAIPSASGQTTLNLQVGTGSDNAEQTTGGTMYVNDSYVQLGSASYGGFRFQNVSVPAGATITSATLQLAANLSSSAAASATVYAQSADSASAFSSSNNNISSRTRTSANVAWTFAAWTQDNWYTSPNISSVIQEVVNRSGWTSGNSVAIILTPGSGSRLSRVHGAGATFAAKLSITYTTAGGGKTILLVTKDPSIGSEEASRKSQFESWGYTVTTIEDSDSQANFDTAVASADVVYVPYTVDGTAVSSKLRSATIGVVWEAVSNLDYQFGLSNGGVNGGSVNTTTDLVVTTHSITSGLSDPLTIYSSSAFQRSINSPVSSSTTLGVLNGTIQPALSVLETGATLANTINSNSVASGRRVRLPFGGGAFTWSQITSGGRSLIQNSLSWASAPSANRTLLLVIAGSSPTSDESLRKTQFEGWGYAVNTIEDSSTQATYDTAVALADVVYIPNTVSESDVSTKLRLAAGGIVSELELLDDEMGFGTSNGGWSNGSTIEVFNNSHPVTQGFSTGTVSILGNNARRSFVQGTPAPAGVGLAYLFTTSAPDLMAIEEGGQLANTLVSNTYASGRRVRLPLANGTFDWADLNSNGLTLIQQALEWASEHAGLKGHWKLDETSGTTAIDSSDSEIDGTYTNGATPGFQGIRRYAANFDGTDDHVTISGGSDYNIRQSVTVACWAKSDTALFSGWGSLVSKRSQFYLHPNYNEKTIYFEVNHAGGVAHSGTYNMSALGGMQKWHHYVGVYDFDTGEVQLYVDGVLRTSSTTTAHTLLSSDTGALTIGKDDGYSSGTRFFDGQIDDVRIYDKALSAAEIVELFGLIGHWKLDETSGTVATDSSSIGNNGNYWNGSAPGSSGPYPGAGANAASIPNYNAHVGVYDNDAYSDLEDGVSVAAWVYFDTAIKNQTAQEYAVSQSDWATQTGFSLHADQPFSDSILFRVFDGTTYSDAIYLSPGIGAGEWHHVVGTYDSFNVKLYVDGQLQATTAFNSTLAPNTGSNLNFGYGQIGRLQDVRLFNRAVTEHEIAQIYGLVGHWKLDETSGSVASDSSGMQRDATLVGTPTLGTSTNSSALGTAVELNGSSDYVTTGSSLANDLDAFTIAGWVRPDNVDAFTTLFGQYGVLEFGMYDTANRIRLWTGNGYAFDYDNALTIGQWTHIAATGDGSQIKLYVDGVEATSVTQSATTYGSSSYNFLIGAGAWAGYGDYFDGTVDDVRLYNRAISPTEALQVYESGFVQGIRIIKWVEAR